MTDPQPTRSIPPDDVPTAPPPADPAACATFTVGPAPDTAAHPPASDPPPTVPGYEVLAEWGRGGMGVVYKARQNALNRVVALKMVRAADRADPKQLIRFLAEAEAVAAVRHPHVVQVFDFGEHQGRPFLALEFLPGGTLADRLREGGPLPPASAAALAARLARAVQAAHALGIVHRDLKPANVLFDEAGEPRVTDFGIAKRAGGADLTATQAVMGTPSYMAPEQAEGRGKFVGPAADVYALGVILYECLTGTVPFDGGEVLSVLRRVVQEEPDPPRKRAPGVPRDLDLVCLKCLAKDPAERYRTAAALADDLDRFGRGEPVTVRAAGVLERGYRWARRNPARAAAFGLGGVAAALAAVGLVLGLAWTEAARAKQEAEAANASLTEAKDVVEQALAGERAARGELVTALDAERALKGRLEAALGGERAAKQQAEEARADLARQGYFRSVDLAHRAALAGDAKRAALLLDQCPPEFRGWEWDHVHRKLNSAVSTFAPLGEVREIAVSPEGPWVAARGRLSPVVQVWDLRTGQMVLVKDQAPRAGMRFAADGRLWLWGGTSGPQVADLQTGDRAQLPPPPSDRGPAAGALSPDGRWAVTQNANLASVSVVDTATGKPVLTIAPEKSGGYFWPSTVFSPDGDRLAVGPVNGRVEVWDIPAGKRVTATGEPAHASLSALAFRPGGTDLLLAGSDRHVRVWDPATGLERFAVPNRGLRHAAYSPDGGRIALWGDAGLAVLDAQSGVDLWSDTSAGQVAGVAFAPDGVRVAAWGGPSVRVLAGGRVLRELLGHDGGVRQAAFAGDGRLVTLGEDGLVRAWDAHAAESFIPLGWRLDYRGAAGAVDPTGTRAAFARVTPAGPGPRGQSRRGFSVWDLTHREAVTTVPGEPGFQPHDWLTFTPDGRQVVAGSVVGRVSQWDLETRQAVPTRFWVVSGRRSAAHPGRQLLAVHYEEERQVTVWDVGRVPGRVVTGGRRSSPEDAGKTLPPDQAPVARGSFPLTGTRPRLLFSPDGGHLAVVPDGAPGVVWEVEAGRGWPLPPVPAVRGDGLFEADWPTVALAPGGGRIAAVSRGGLRVFDTRSGAEALVLPRPADGNLYSPTFSADGRKLYALTPAGVVTYESAPRPPFVPQPTDPAPPPRPAAGK